MKPWKLFDLIKESHYQTVGDGLDYCIDYIEEEDTVYVLFEQSRGAVDWRTNLNFIPYLTEKTPYGKIAFHGGYYRAFLSGLGQILIDFESMIKDHESSNVIISGWSYGGGISVLCAWAINKYFNIKASVITFGAPKVLCTKKSLKALNHMCGEVKQYSHVNDLVPLLPPIGFYHINKVDVGSGKRWYRIFNPNKYHTMYGDKAIYKE